mgnify:CR=1 FL=1
MGEPFLSKLKFGDTEIADLGGAQSSKSDLSPEQDDRIKDKIIEHLKTSRHEDIHTWANYLYNNDSSEYFSEFLRLTDVHDLYRNLNFANTFPEVKKLLDLTK